MPLFDFKCTCGLIAEHRVSAADRDTVTIICECGGQMGRLFSMPMAVLWVGKFQGRWDKIQPDPETGDIEW